MNLKQDRSGVRTAQDLERKYKLSFEETAKKTEGQLTKVEKELENFVNSTTASLKEIKEGAVTTWYYKGEPLESTEPTKNWTLEEKEMHIGDLYYDKETGYSYIFEKVNDMYKWSLIQDKDIQDALSIAGAAKDTADNKRRVFLTTPIPPYENGDLWLNNKKIYVCQISKLNTEIYEDGDFIIATDYTDDTYAQKVEEELTVVKGTVTKIKESNDKIEQTVEETIRLLETKKDVTGNNHLYLEECSNAQIINYSVEGNSYQQDNPSPDNPQEIQTVKGVTNLLNIERWSCYQISNALPIAETNYIDINKLSNNSINFTIKGNEYVIVASNPIQLEPNTQYTLSYERQNSKSINSRYYIYNYNNETYTINHWETDNNKGLSYTFTTDSNGKVVIGFGVSNQANGTICEVSNIIIEKGNKFHQYVPYGTWLPIKNVGKNLLDLTNVVVGNSITQSGNTTINELWNHTKKYTKIDISLDYTISAKKDNSSSPFQINIVEYDKSFKFLTRQILNSSNEITNTSKNPIFNTNTKYILFQYRNDCGIYDVQLEQGTEATEYEPYQEKIALIDMNKQNIFDGELILANLNTNGQAEYVNYRLCSKDYISVNPSTNYTIKNDKYTGSMIVCDYDENKSFISRRVISSINRELYFTTTSTTRYIKFCNDGYGSNSKNDLNTKYEIYEGINSYYELCKIGDIHDELNIDDVGNVTINKRIGKVILSDIEGLNYESDNSRCYFNIVNGLIENQRCPILSNYFQSLSEQVVNKPNIAFEYNGSIFFYLPTTYNTLDKYKQWVTENTPTFYYQLKEEQSKNIGTLNATLFKGTNHIYLLDDLDANTSVTYFLNTELNNIFSKKSEFTMLSNLLSLKLNVNDLTRAYILAKITNDGKSAIDLGADNVSIKSDNFNVDKDGNITCSNAKLISGSLVLMDGGGEDASITILDTQCLNTIPQLNQDISNKKINIKQIKNFILFNLPTTNSPLLETSGGFKIILESTTGNSKYNYLIKAVNPAANLCKIGFDENFINHYSMDYLILFNGVSTTSNAGVITKISNLSLANLIVLENDSSMMKISKYSSSGFESDIYNTYLLNDKDYTEEDMKELQKILLRGSWTNEELAKYDANGDNILSSVDLITMQKLIKLGASKDKPAHLSINTSTTDTADGTYEIIKLISGNGEKRVTIGLNGIYAKELECDNLILKDSDWKDLPLASGVTEGSLCGTPQYRKLGNHVFVRGGIGFTIGNSTMTLATLPEGYRPSCLTERMNGTGGSRIARIGIRDDGTLFIDWIYNLNDKTKFTGAVSWLDIAMDFFID